jgi:hypothetical protein
MLVRKRVEVRAAAGFVEPGSTADDEFLALAQTLGMDRPRSADHADSGELGDRVSNSHEIGNRPKRFGSERRVESGHNDALAKGDEFDGEGNDGSVEELDLLDTDDF